MLNDKEQKDTQSTSMTVSYALVLHKSAVPGHYVKLIFKMSFCNKSNEIVKTKCMTFCHSICRLWMSFVWKILHLDSNKVVRQYFRRLASSEINPCMSFKHGDKTKLFNGCRSGLYDGQCASSQPKPSNQCWVLFAVKGRLLTRRNWIGACHGRTSMHAVPYMPTYGCYRLVIMLRLVDNTQSGVEYKIPPDPLHQFGKVSRNFGWGLL